MPDHIDEFGTWDDALAALCDNWPMYSVMVLSARKDGKYISYSAIKDAVADRMKLRKSQE
jgi:hypothetical protein